ASIATKLASEEKVAVLFGPATSGGTAVATPAASQAGVPLLTAAATQDDLTVKDGKVEDYIFRATFQDSYQGKVISNFANA
ncbi:ABC transporter substrate-binding protein, partial [Streptococcus pyogenes]